MIIPTDEEYKKILEKLNKLITLEDFIF